MSTIKFNVSPSRRLMMLALTYILGLIISSFLSSLLLRIGGDARHTAMLRIATILQDVLMLVLPAAVTAVVVCGNAGCLLAIDRRPGVAMTVMAMITMIVSSPFMSYIIELNASMTLPPAFAGFERALREMEQNAASSIAAVTGPHTIPNLIMSVLVIGIAAGFSEELFFRGALQRLMRSTGLSGHAAVWISAAVFSAVHFQFFGFVPRLLLGAWFGYLLLWSGSVWLPMAAHIFNNVMYVILNYITGSGDPHISPEVVSPWISVSVSAALTVACVIFTYKLRNFSNKNS